MRRSVLSFWLCAGCAATAPQPQTAESVVRSGPDRGAVVDSKTGEPVSVEALMSALGSTRVVYVGERHDQPADHAVQYAVVRGLHTAQPSLAIGLEMFQVPFQEPLDDWSAGRIDETVLRRETEYDDRWGYDFGMLRPVLEYARNHAIPVIALNAPREVAFAVAQGGVDALDAEVAATLPELDFDDPEHRALFDAEFDVGEHGAEETVDQFYQAQVLWDETMGARVAETLASREGPSAMVVLAGRVHVKRGLGIPERAGKRGARPYIVILPVTKGELKRELALPASDRSADFFWTVSP